MNTLNYKALFISTGIVVFIRAIGIYLLMTLPVVAANFYMYMVSAVYAVSFGWIACAFFLFIFYMLYKIKGDAITKTICLYGSVAIAVAIAFQMMEVLGVEEHVWQSGGFLLFPALAIVSGWISLVVSKKAIRKLFVPETIVFYDTVFSDAVPGNKF